jgi:prevent-host-death family protein
MQEIAISEFKAKCLALLEEVNKTKQPIRITRRGKPVAEVVPVTQSRKRPGLGSMAGTVKILGDIVSPVVDLNELEGIAIEIASGYPCFSQDHFRAHRKMVQTILRWARKWSSVRAPTVLAFTGQLWFPPRRF